MAARVLHRYLKVSFSPTRVASASLAQPVSFSLVLNPLFFLFAPLPVSAVMDVRLLSSRRRPVGAPDRGKAVAKDPQQTEELCCRSISLGALTGDF